MLDTTEMDNNNDIQNSTEYLSNVPASKMKGQNKFPPLRIFLISLLVTTGASFHYGYQLTLTSPAEEAFVAFVNESITAHYSMQLDRHRLEVQYMMVVWRRRRNAHDGRNRIFRKHIYIPRMHSTIFFAKAIWSSIVALFFVGAVFGSVSLSKFADMLGRRPGIIVANLAIVISAALEAATKFVKQF